MHAAAHMMDPTRKLFRTTATRFIAIPVFSGLILGLTGCGSDGSTEAAVPTTTVTEQAEPTVTAAEDAPAEADSPTTALADAFQQVLAAPATHPVNSAAEYSPTGTYSYAIVEATSDSSPEMLLRVNSREFSPVLVFTSGDTPDELVRSTDVLIQGAAGVGGSRARLVASQSGAGIHQIDHHSLRPTGRSTLYSLQGTSLRQSSAPVEFTLETPLPDHQDIIWYESTDLQGIEALRTGSTPSVAAPTPVPPVMDTSAHQFTGRVTEQSTSEVMKGQPTPNGEPETNRYLVLVLDQPMEVTAQTAGRDTRTRTISEVSLGERTAAGPENEWSQHIGQQVTVGADPHQIRYPTDTGLPLGMLRLQGYNSLTVN